MKRFFYLVSLLSLACCTTPRAKVYEDLIEPMVGVWNQPQVNSRLGNPTYCKGQSGLLQCEYRTAAGRNLPTQEVHQRIPTMGPDLSPYENFDVLYLYFDDMGRLKDWTPVVILP